MCIADIAISRRCYPVRTALVTNTITAVPANPDRVALYLAVPYGSSRSGGIALSAADVSLEMFLASYSSRVSATNDYFGMESCYIDYRSHPGIVQGSLAVYSANATSYYVESIMNDDLANELRQYLKEQRSAYTRRG